MTARDIELSGCEADDPAIRQMEKLWPHRVEERRAILKYIPKGSRGAEFGVLTGLFSGMLAAEDNIAEITFVDPWWNKFGKHYPAHWGVYSLYGEVATETAHQQACRRIETPGLPNRRVEVAFAQDWLTTLPAGALDWAYCDCTLDPDEHLKILTLLDIKLRTGNALIIGDDWNADGIFLAVNDFLKGYAWDLIFADGTSPYQYMLRRRYKYRSAPHADPYNGNPLRIDVGYDMFMK